MGKVKKKSVFARDEHELFVRENVLDNDSVEVEHDVRALRVIKIIGSIIVFSVFIWMFVSLILS